MATVFGHDAIVQFGEFLRMARERRGLTLQQVARTTKIPWRHLDAIEHGDFSLVPRGPYRHGEVRAFAQAIGLDQNAAVAQLDEAMGRSPHEAPAPSRASAIAEPRSWRPTISAVLLVAVGAGLLLWVRGPAGTPTSPAPASSSVEAPLPATPRPAETPPVVPAAAVAATPVAAASPAMTPTTTSGAAPAPAVAPVLVVTSEPPGARVVVDGIGRGETPLTVHYLSLGEKRVRIVRDGYLSEERTVGLTADRPTATVQVELQPAPKQ